MSGKDVAEKMLRDNGIYDVQVISAQGFLSDHYNPADKTVNLSPDVYEGRSIASAAVAAHECGLVFGSSPTKASATETVAASPTAAATITTNTAATPTAASSSSLSPPASSSVAFAAGVVDNEPAPGSGPGATVTPHPIAEEAEVAAAAAIAAGIAPPATTTANGHRRTASKGHVRGASHARSSSLLNSLDDFDFAAEDGDENGDGDGDAGSPTAIKHTRASSTSATPAATAEAEPTTTTTDNDGVPAPISVTAEVKGPPLPSSPVPPMPKRAPPSTPPQPPVVAPSSPSNVEDDSAAAVSENGGDEPSPAGNGNGHASPSGATTSAFTSPATAASPSSTVTPPVRSSITSPPSTGSQRKAVERKDRAHSIAVSPSTGAVVTGRSQSVKRPGSGRRRSLDGTSPASGGASTAGGSPPTFSSQKNPRLFTPTKPYVTVRDHATTATLAKITVKSHKSEPGYHVSEREKEKAADHLYGLELQRKHEATIRKTKILEDARKLAEVIRQVNVRWMQSTTEQRVSMERQQSDRADEEKKRIMAARAVRDERERKLREEEERLWKAETSKLSYIGALREGRADPTLSPEDLTLEQIAILEAKFHEDEAVMVPHEKRGSRIWTTGALTGESRSDKKGPDSFMLRNQARIEKIQQEQQRRDEEERRRLGKQPPASVKRQTARKEAMERKKAEEDERKAIEDEQREKLAAALRDMEEQKRLDREREEREAAELKQAQDQAAAELAEEMRLQEEMKAEEKRQHEARVKEEMDRAYAELQAREAAKRAEEQKRADEEARAKQEADQRAEFNRQLEEQNAAKAKAAADEQKRQEDEAARRLEEETKKKKMEEDLDMKALSSGTDVIKVPTAPGTFSKPKASHISLAGDEKNPADYIVKWESKKDEGASQIKVKEAILYQGLTCPVGGFAANKGALAKQYTTEGKSQLCFTLYLSHKRTLDVVCGNTDDYSRWIRTLQRLGVQAPIPGAILERQPSALSPRSS